MEFSRLNSFFHISSLVFFGLSNGGRTSDGPTTDMRVVRVDERLPWHAAAKACEDRGGQLSRAPTSADFRSVWWALIPEDEELWLGARDVRTPLAWLDKQSLYESLGCFPVDAVTSLIQSAFRNIPNVHACFVKCRRGHIALKKDVCLCLQDVPQDATANRSVHSCTQRCAGTPQDICGGLSSYSVYRTGLDSYYWYRPSSFDPHVSQCGYLYHSGGTTNPVLATIALKLDLCGTGSVLRKRALCQKCERQGTAPHQCQVLIHKAYTTWDGAHAWCQDRNMTLATLAPGDLRTYFAFQQGTQEYYWLGLRSDFHLAWVDGSLVMPQKQDVLLRQGNCMAVIKEKGTGKLRLQLNDCSAEKGFLCDIAGPFGDVVKSTPGESTTSESTYTFTTRSPLSKYVNTTKSGPSSTPPTQGTTREATAVLSNSSLPSQPWAVPDAFSPSQIVTTPTASSHVNGRIPSVFPNTSHHNYGNDNRATVERTFPTKIVPSTPIVSSNPSSRILASSLCGSQTPFSQFASSKTVPSTPFVKSTWFHLSGAEDISSTLRMGSRTSSEIYQQTFTIDPTLSTTIISNTELLVTKPSTAFSTKVLKGTHTTSQRDVYSSTSFYDVTHMTATPSDSFSASSAVELSGLDLTTTSSSSLQLQSSPSLLPSTSFQSEAPSLTPSSAPLSSESSNRRISELLSHESQWDIQPSSKGEADHHSRFSTTMLTDKSSSLLITASHHGGISSTMKLSPSSTVSYISERSRVFLSGNSAMKTNATHGSVDNVLKGTTATTGETVVGGSSLFPTKVSSFLHVVDKTSVSLNPTEGTPYAGGITPCEGTVCKPHSPKGVNTDEGTLIAVYVTAGVVAVVMVLSTSLALVCIWVRKRRKFSKLSQLFSPSNAPPKKSNVCLTSLPSSPTRQSSI